MLPMILILASGGIALLFAIFTAVRLLRVDSGNQRMREIGDAIKAGAAAFLKREYLTLLPFVIIVAVLIGVLIDFYALGSSTSLLYTSDAADDS